MRRYIVGTRATHDRPRSQLTVYDRPPLFVVIRDRDGRIEPERISWRGDHNGFHARRGIVDEWRSEGRSVVARVLPEDAYPDLAAHDASVDAAREALRRAEADRLDFLESLVPRAERVRVEEARAERAAWEASDEYRAEVEARKRKNAEEAARAQRYVGALNGLMREALSGGGRR